MSQFADDGAIWKSGPNLKHLHNKIQQDLDNICDSFETEIWSISSNIKYNLYAVNV
jgi:hypothetical protein